MKIMKKNILKIVLFVILLFQDIVLIAKRRPPITRGGFGDEHAVGESIDDFIPFFILIAVVYGIWSQYKKMKPIAIK